MTNFDLAKLPELLERLGLQWKNDAGYIEQPPMLMGMWNRERAESAAAIRALMQQVDYWKQNNKAVGDALFAKIEELEGERNAALAVLRDWKDMPGNKRTMTWWQQWTASLNAILGGKDST